MLSHLRDAHSPVKGQNRTQRQDERGFSGCRNNRSGCEYFKGIVQCVGLHPLSTLTS